jgi:hypothetical protein
MPKTLHNADTPTLLAQQGWRRVAYDANIAHWAHAALAPAQHALAQDTTPRRCAGTWAVGLDLLPNDAAGSVAGVAFPWQALGLSACALHAGQISTIFPGYPQHGSEESDAAYGFRLRRDAAHLDGLLPVGPQRLRMLQEPHSWIVGIALNACTPNASPLVLWQGSHEKMRQALHAVLRNHPPSHWPQIDLTAAYQAARADVFASCPRIAVPLLPGEAIVLHRLTVHGMAPWAADAHAPAEGRMVAYFRPLLASMADWLHAP